MNTWIPTASESFNNIVVGSAVEANVMFSTSLVQTKLRAVVQTHVGVTEQAAGRFLQR